MSIPQGNRRVFNLTITSDAGAGSADKTIHMPDDFEVSDNFRAENHSGRRHRYCTDMCLAKSPGIIACCGRLACEPTNQSDASSQTKSNPKLVRVTKLSTKTAWDNSGSIDNIGATSPPRTRIIASLQQCYTTSRVSIIRTWGGLIRNPTLCPTFASSLSSWSSTRRC